MYYTDTLSSKDFTSTFDGSYGRCGQSKSTLFVRGQKLPALPLLAKEMVEQHAGLLFYTKVRWLSRGKRFSRLYKLKHEVEIFLQENRNNLDVQFQNKGFVMMLAYLTDVFGHNQRHEIVFARP